MMSSRGLRITDQRRTLAGLFADTDGYLTAKDVYDYMGKRYSGLSFDTVYRNLRVMHDMGIVEQFVFEDGVKFRAHCDEHHHHHHLFCLNCEKTVPIVYCPMTRIEGVPEDFQVVRHKFEIYGYCSSCKAEGKEEAAAPHAH
ncbi:Fur family transcriptional regulator [Paenibacillus sp. HJGM_3]|uniref:Fur family transcriptional regulator n=1 Tax=Paenibacillus sp. HJGM_3 TaxID=3379816 RepID=UPI00385B9588